MKIAIHIVRSILGLIFIVFGLNGFLNFLPMPQEQPELVMKFMTGVMATGYFMPVLKGTEIIAGIMLLSNRLPALGLVILAPIVIQIFLFHAFVAPAGLPIAIFLVLAEAFLAYGYRNAYSSVLALKVDPKAL